MFTLLNALSGLTAILLAAGGQVEWAIYAIFLGILLDGVDGAVSRMGKGGGPLGGTLDTLSDTVSFVVAPAVIILASEHLEVFSKGGWPVLIVAAFYASCGLLRLARFEALRQEVPRHYFSGLPTPGAALLLLGMILLRLPLAVVLPTAFVCAVLMVSRIRYPKLRSKGGILALSSIVAVLATIPYVRVHELATYTLLSLMIFFILAGPFYVLTRYGPVKVRR